MTQFNVSLLLTASATDAEVVLKAAKARLKELGDQAKQTGQQTEAMGQKQRKAAGDAELLASKNRLAAGSVGNLFANFNDIGVMMASGQSPLMLALQQGTQVSQVLGPLGAGGAVRALGSAFLALVSPINLITIGSIAAGAATFQWLTSSGEAAQTLEDRLETATDAVAAYGEAVDAVSIPMDKLIERYGAMATAIRQVQVQEAELARSRANRAVTEALGDFGARDALQGVSAQDLRSSEGMRRQADEMYQQIQNLRSILTTDNAGFFDFSKDYAEIEFLRQRVLAVDDGLAEMAATMGINGDQARAIAIAMAEVEANARGSAAEQVAAGQALVAALVAAYGSIDAADQATDGLVSGLLDAMQAAGDVAAADMAGNIGGAAGQAAVLAANLRSAAAYSALLASTGTASGPDAVRTRQFGGGIRGPDGGFFTPQVTGAGLPRITIGTGSGSAGGGGGAARAEADAIGTLITRLRGEIDLARESDPIQREMLRLRKELTGATAEQRAEVETLIGTREREKAAMESLNYVTQQTGDALIDALMGASGAGERLIQTLSRAVLQAALLGQGPLAALFGGVGLFGAKPGGGGLLSGLLGAFIRPAATRSAAPAIAAAPPRFAKTSFGTAPGFAASGGGAGGMTRVQIDLGPGLVAQILDQARDQSIEITQTGLQTFDREALPARMAAINRDPRRKG